MISALRLFAVLLATSASASAAQQGDAISNEGEATALAAKICVADSVSQPTGHWSAMLQDGVWHATFKIKGLPEDCPLVSIGIRANDGAIQMGQSFTPSHAIETGCSMCAY